MKHIRGFTLVEMLIVIVIIGILASSLMPRLSSVADKSRDTARRADIQQIVSALSIMYIETDIYPTSCTNGRYGLGGTTCNVSDLAGLSSYISSIPKDPQSTSFMSEYILSTGQYVFVNTKKNGIAKKGFVIISKASTEGFANRVNIPGSMTIVANTDIVNYLPCGSVVKSGSAIANTGGGVCTYVNAADLRYIVFGN